MERIYVTYKFVGEDPKAIADVIRAEQTIEFPFELAAKWIQDEVVGKVEEISSIDKNNHLITISFNPDVTGGELNQFLNVLWGNVSLFPGVKIVELKLPDLLLEKFKGPRFGITGLRKLFGAQTRPLISTALKPMGSDAKTLAEMARTLALVGFDLIKDDHSLANQPWATWKERVTFVARAVQEANAITGRHTAYAPSLNLPFDQISDAAHTAKELGAGALLILPGITGFDSLRKIASDDSIALPIQGHPAMLGSLLTSKFEGISHGIVLGTLMRLAGADISIFPNIGGRFSFSQEQCLDVTDRSREKLGNLKPLLVAPAGGMSLERIPEMVEMYGKDTALLIGGALSRGSLADNAARMCEMVHAY
ncbi:RbcL Ribulose 1,5-bisphosphate carboxylase, large subunit [Candidatus Nanopelagicaceae bacterium]